MKIKSAVQNELSNEFLLCRTFLHSWDKLPNSEIGSPIDGWQLSLFCTRCTTERHDTVSYKTGELVRRRYIYPRDYKITEVLTRSDMRLEFARRNNYNFIKGQ